MSTGLCRNGHIKTQPGYCKKCKYECFKRWLARNPDKAREYSRKFASQRYSLKRKSWYRTLEQNARWKRDHPESRVRHQVARRARKMQAEGVYTDQEWQEQIRQQDARCYDCGERRKLTVGHLVPLSKGGSNYISNIVGQCASCNSKQGARIHPSVQGVA